MDGVRCDKRLRYVGYISKDDGKYQKIVKYDIVISHGAGHLLCCLRYVTCFKHNQEFGIT